MVQNPTPGPDTVGIFRPSRGMFYLRFSNTQGIADTQFEYGNRNMLPVAGDFGVLTGGDDPPPGPIIGTSAVVTRIVDCDTIDVVTDVGTFRVRLIGIDTPEVGECYFQEATNRLASLIDGKAVTLVKDVSEVDRYGRLLRYVYLGTQHINETMVREGYAVAADYPPDSAFAADFKAAEDAARAAGLGLWGGCSTPTPPTCDPSYPTVCIRPPPPDLDCGDIPYRRFKVLQPDPHRFDGDKDGVGCES